MSYVSDTYILAGSFCPIVIVIILVLLGRVYSMITNLIDYRGPLQKSRHGANTFPR
jgi:hypothetical protein